MQSKIFLVGTFVLLLLVSCSHKGNQQNNNEETSGSMPAKVEPVNVGNETQLLLDDLKANGDYVNSRNFPSLIKAQSVYDELNKNNLIIDIRSNNEFIGGHIKDAVHKDFSELPDYFVSDIKPFEYQRIVIVSADGQEAAYTTCLLRLMGYGNVYALRWGMSSWDEQNAQEGWFKGISSDFRKQIETKENIAKPGTVMPELGTGKSTGEEIGTARFMKLFEDGLNDVMIHASDVFANPSNYYVINYDRKDKYLDGHIPGAVRYKPGATLSFVDEMASIPANKPVVVYCGTGHNSAFVTAYLRLFGYDAHTLAYGNNSFMYGQMVEHRSTLSWLPFTHEEVHNFEVVK